MTKKDDLSNIKKRITSLTYMALELKESSEELEKMVEILIAAAKQDEASEPPTVIEGSKEPGEPIPPRGDND